MPDARGFPKDDADFRKMYPHAPCGRVLRDRRVDLFGRLMGPEVICGSMWCMHPYASIGRKTRKTRRRRTSKK